MKRKRCIILAIIACAIFAVILTAVVRLYKISSAFEQVISLKDPTQIEKLLAPNVNIVKKQDWVILHSNNSDYPTSYLTNINDIQPNTILAGFHFYKNASVLLIFSSPIAETSRSLSGRYREYGVMVDILGRIYCIDADI